MSELEKLQEELRVWQAKHDVQRDRANETLGRAVKAWEERDRLRASVVRVQELCDWILSHTIGAPDAPTAGERTLARRVLDTITREAP